MNSAVEIERLVVRRGGNEVLRDVSARVPAGEVAGLLGPSGCGKTTLMRAIVGVQKVAGGAVRVLGRPAGARELRTRVGYVTQAPSVYADLTIDENLRYFARVLGAPPERVDQALAAVDLARSGHRLVGTLSGGQRSRVSLAVALLGSPELLVLDEPTVGLDPLLRVVLWRLFGRLARGGATLRVSSHSLEEARHCDDLLLMRDGEVLVEDSPAGLRRRTGHDNLEDAFVALVSERAGEAVPA